MISVIRDGRLGFGCEPASIPVKVVNRVGTSLLTGETLMCDILNSAYDSDADEGGVFGNGITPTAGNHDLMFAPIVLTTGGGGTASGTVISGIVHGVATARVTNLDGLSQIRRAIEQATAVRNPDVAPNAYSATVRYVGYQVGTPHTTATGVENITVSFNGLPQH